MHAGKIWEYNVAVLLRELLSMSHPLEKGLGQITDAIVAENLEYCDKSITKRLRLPMLTSETASND